MAKTELAANSRFAVIAGSGLLPADVARSLHRRGHEPFIFRVIGEANADFSAFDGMDIGIGDAAGLFRTCKQQGVTHLVMAGGIKRRPSWREIRLSMGLLPAALRIAKGLLSGDDRLLGTAISVVEKRGITVVGVQDILPEIIAGAGSLGRIEPSSAGMAAARLAFAAARAIGALDAGQAAVAAGRRVIALEGAEGTASMLARVALLKADGRISNGGVLAKCRKPDQESRADLPAIGPETIRAAAEAGLAGVVVEAGGTLILDLRETLELADAKGIFIFGLAASEALQ